MVRIRPQGISTSAKREPFGSCFLRQFGFIQVWPHWSGLSRWGHTSQRADSPSQRHWIQACPHHTGPLATWPESTAMEDITSWAFKEPETTTLDSVYDWHLFLKEQTQQRTNSAPSNLLVSFHSQGPKHPRDSFPGVSVCPGQRPKTNRVRETVDNREKKMAKDLGHKVILF